MREQKTLSQGRVRLISLGVNHQTSAVGTKQDHRCLSRVGTFKHRIIVTLFDPAVDDVLAFLRTTSGVATLAVELNVRVKEISDPILPLGPIFSQNRGALLFWIHQ